MFLTLPSFKRTKHGPLFGFVFLLDFENLRNSVLSRSWIENSLWIEPSACAHKGGESSPDLLVSIVVFLVFFVVNSRVGNDI